MIELFSDAMFPISEDLCLRWMITLLHSLWQGIVVGVLAAAAVWLMRERSAASRYLLYSSALICLPVCVAVTFLTVSVPAITGSSDLVPGMAALELQPDGGSGRRETLPTTGLPEAKSVLQSEPVLEAASPAKVNADELRYSASERFVQPESATSDHAALTWLTPMAPWSVAAWLIGVSVFLLRLVMAVRGGHRLWTGSMRMEDPALLELMLRQSRKIGLRFVPAIAFCQRIAVPTVVGIIRPALLLPASIMAGLDPQQFEAILIHELAHIRRHDLWLNLLQRLIESLLFFHPVVWFISRRMSAEREVCCDDLVVSTGCRPMDYAGALLRMAELCVSTRQSTVVTMAATGSHPLELEMRMHRLMNYQPPSKLRVSHAGVIAAALIGIVSAVAPAVFSSWVSASTSVANQNSEALVDPGTTAISSPSGIFASHRESGENQSSSAANTPQAKPQPPVVTGSFTVDEPLIRGKRLSSFPSNTEPARLPDLYVEAPAGSGNFEWFPDVCFIPLEDFEIFYRPDRELFFIRTGRNIADSDVALVFHGPIPGNPVEELKLEPWLLERMKDFGTAGNPGISMRRMASHANAELAATGLRLMRLMLIDEDALKSIDEHSELSHQAERNLDMVEQFLESHGEQLREAKVDGIAELEQAIDAMESRFDAAMSESIFSNYNEAGYLQNDIVPDDLIRWGSANNGLRLGLSMDFEVAHGGEPHVVTLIVQNVSHHQIRFHIEGHIAERVGMKVTDIDGSEVPTESGDTPTSLLDFPSAWRLERGEKLVICDNRLAVTLPDSQEEPLGIRGHRSALIRMRAEAGQYAVECKLPLNERRVIRSRGEWYGQLTSAAVPISVSMKGAQSGNNADPADPVSNGRIQIKYDIPGADADGKITVFDFRRQEYVGIAEPPAGSMKVNPVRNGDTLELTDLTPGEYEVSRYRNAAGHGRTLDRHRFQLAAGETKAIDFSRSGGKQVSGRVVNLNGLNLAATLISVFPESAHDVRLSDWTTFIQQECLDFRSCDATGEFTTDPLVPGKYTVFVEGFEPWPTNAVESGEERPRYHGKAEVIVPKSGEPATIEVTLMDMWRDIEWIHYTNGANALKFIDDFKPAWSEPKQGIEFGLIRTGGQRQFHTGEWVPLVMFVRNVSDRVLKVSLTVDFQANGPEVRDSQGRLVPLKLLDKSNKFSGYRETLQPGEAFGFRTYGLRLGENPKPKEQSWFNPYWENPVAGTYTLRQVKEIRVEPLDNPAAAQSVELTTGTIEFDVVNAENAGV